MTGAGSSPVRKIGCDRSERDGAVSHGPPAPLVTGPHDPPILDAKRRVRVVDIMTLFNVEW